MSIEPRRSVDDSLAADRTPPEESRRRFGTSRQRCRATVDQWSALLNLPAAS